MAMITDIADYYTKGCGRCARFDTPDCSARIWHDGLILLRDICSAAGLDEHVKWGHPTFMHAGRNIAVIGAFRSDFRLSFFEAGLMTDPAGVLVGQGPNTPTPGTIKFCDARDVQDQEAVITAYLKEAMGYAAAGKRAPKIETTLEWPDELTEALDADPTLAEAFRALTPGRQKSYLINLNGAKQAQTRINRIAKFRDKIIAGKGALDR